MMRPPFVVSGGAARRLSQEWGAPFAEEEEEVTGGCRVRSGGEGWRKEGGNGHREDAPIGAITPN